MTQTAERDIKWEVCRNGEALHQRTDNTMEDALNRAVDVIVADLQTKLEYNWTLIRKALVSNPDMTVEEASLYTGWTWAQFNSHRTSDDWLVTIPRGEVVALLTSTENDDSYDWEDWETPGLYDLVARVGDGYLYTISFGENGM